ncbi:MAG: hypothetical protein ACI8P0_004057 [Planctomycetaceae bacterium]|jgi:hypothetical protein
MSWLRNIAARLTGRHADQFENQLHDELQFHVDRQTEENLRSGMDRATARREALRQFGGVEQVREEVRDVSRIVWLSDLFRDTKFSLRMLGRSPAFTASAVVVLGLAIGLSTTIFSFVRAILIEPLPFANSDRLVVIRTFNPQRELPLVGASWPDIVDWKKSAKSFSDMAAFKTGDMDLSDGKSTQRIRGLFVTRNFFELLGIPFVLGRTFTESEEKDSVNSLIFSGDLWARRRCHHRHRVDGRSPFEVLVEGAISSAVAFGVLPGSIFAIGHRALRRGRLCRFSKEAGDWDPHGPWRDGPVDRSNDRLGGPADFRSGSGGRPLPEPRAIAVSAEPVVRHQRSGSSDARRGGVRLAAGDQPGEPDPVDPWCDDQPRDRTSLKLTARAGRYEETYRPLDCLGVETVSLHDSHHDTPPCAHPLRSLNFRPDLSKTD